MASIWIAPRVTKSGVQRFDVRFEGPPLRRDDGTTRRRLHLGAFATEKQALKRKEWAENEWAAGRAPDPRRILADQLPATGPKMSVVIDDWLSSRRDIAASTRVSYKRWAGEVERAFGGDPQRVTPADVRGWIGDLEGSDPPFGPGTIRLAHSILSMILEHAECEPNPARHRTVKLPPSAGPRIRLPSSRELAQIRAAMRRSSYQRMLDFLEDTGCRVSEAVALDWSMVEADRILIPGVKGRGGTVKPRWIDEDLHPIRLLREEPGAGRVFGVSVKGFTGHLYAACNTAKVRRYSPHDLRHLHLSRLMRSTPRVADVAARAGHVNPKVLIDTYTHQIAPG